MAGSLPTKDRLETGHSHPFSSSYHHHLLVLALVSTLIAEITLGVLATSSVNNRPNVSVFYLNVTSSS
jgi:hypothetical protein